MMAQHNERGLSESSVRRRARAQGYVLHKSRVRNPDHPDYGMFVLRYWRTPVGGGDRCGSLKEADQYLN